MTGPRGGTRGGGAEEEEGRGGKQRTDEARGASGSGAGLRRRAAHARRVRRTGRTRGCVEGCVEGYIGGAKANTPRAEAGRARRTAQDLHHARADEASGHPALELPLEALLQVLVQVVEDEEEPRRRGLADERGTSSTLGRPEAGSRGHGSFEAAQGRSGVRRLAPGRRQAGRRGGGLRQGGRHYQPAEGR